MLEVLKDTVQFYSKNPGKRGIVYKTGFQNNSCMFLTPEGNKCAVGRYLNKNDLKTLKACKILEGDVESLLDPGTVGKITTRIIKNLPIKFWQDLQSFHDADVYWNDNGMTNYGKSKAKMIEEKIAKGIYHG